tara:strand:- start:4890 stop:5804 length:915 start_codon:yes stop_codon:yes gene_type:complete
MGIKGKQIADNTVTGDDVNESTLVIDLQMVTDIGSSTTNDLSLSNINPSAGTFNIGNSNNIWNSIYADNGIFSNQIRVSSSVANQELIRLEKGDSDSRYLVFESGGEDKFEMYLNSYENFTFTTTATTDDIGFRLNGHQAITLQGYPKEVRIWDGFNAVYHTKINSSLDVNGTTKTEAIIPKTDATYDLGDPITNVWNNMFAKGATVNVVSLPVSASDPALVANSGKLYSKDVAGSAEIFVQDEAGNVTQISPHNESNEWEYFSKNIKTGKVLKINMEKMIRRLEEITGESFIQEWYDNDGTNE